METIIIVASLAIAIVFVLIKSKRDAENKVDKAPPLPPFDHVSETLRALTEFQFDQTTTIDQLLEISPDQFRVGGVEVKADGEKLVSAHRKLPSGNVCFYNYTFDRDGHLKSVNSQVVRKIEEDSRIRESKPLSQTRVQPEDYIRTLDVFLNLKNKVPEVTVAKFARIHSSKYFDEWKRDWVEQWASEGENSRKALKIFDFLCLTLLRKDSSSDDWRRIQRRVSGPFLSRCASLPAGEIARFQMEDSIQSAQRIIGDSENVNSPDPQLKNLIEKSEEQGLDEKQADAEMGKQPTSIRSDGTRIYATPMTDGCRTRFTIYRPDGSVESFKAFNTSAQ